MKIRKILLLILLFAFYSLDAQKVHKTENFVLVTLDGLRWQEVFGGAADSLLNDPDYVSDTTQLQSLFGGYSSVEKREKLLPFFWQTIAKAGQLYGNRWQGNKVNCTNDFWFSYPGYNEILTGYGDPAINSNDKIWNPNATVLEWLNKLPEYHGKVAAFGSWEVFPYIINERRSGIPVNAGFETVQDANLTSKEAFLNELQAQIPSPWASVRLDAFTHNYALEYLKRKHPKILYIAYGETDDFGHDGRYDHYLKSARQTSNWLEELWNYLQNDPFYKNKTTLLLTTDHGRGDSPKKAWKSHGKSFKGSDAIWLAVIGPDTPALGVVNEKGQLFQNQIAKTIAAFLGLDYENIREVGPVIQSVMR